MQRSKKILASAAALCVACGQYAFAQQTPPAAAAVVPPPPPPPKWDVSASLGLSLTRGNSDTTLLNGAIGAKRKWDHSELELGGDGAYGTDKGVKNNETLHGFGQYNYLFT